jgi:hypothetical protein
MNSEEPRDERVGPWWETAAMIGAFALLWAFLLARNASLQVAAQSGAAAPRPQLSPLWTIAQYAAIAVLVLVLVRRVKRTRDAMRQVSQIKPGLPFGVPSSFGTNGNSQNGHQSNGHRANPLPRNKTNGKPKT